MTEQEIIARVQSSVSAIKQRNSSELYQKVTGQIQAINKKIRVAKLQTKI
jgi:hypothetical protein